GQAGRPDTHVRAFRDEWPTIMPPVDAAPVSVVSCRVPGRRAPRPGNSMDWKAAARAPACPAWLGLALPLSAGGLQARPVELPAGTNQLSLTPHLQYRHDSGAADGIADAIGHLRAGRFQPVPGGNATFGFQPGAFRFHAAIINRNPDEQRWLLVQE